MITLRARTGRRDLVFPRRSEALRVWQPWIIVVVVTAIAVGWGLAVYNLGISRKDASAVAALQTRNGELIDQLTDANARVDAMLEREDAVRKREEAVRVREDTVTRKEQARSTITDGTWTVGSDIQPGSYRTKTTVSSGCAWAIFSDPDGTQLTTSGTGTGSRASLTVEDGQHLTTQGCGTWARV